MLAGLPLAIPCRHPGEPSAEWRRDATCFEQVELHENRASPTRGKLASISPIGQTAARACRNRLRQAQEAQQYGLRSASRPSQLTARAAKEVQNRPLPAARQDELSLIRAVSATICGVRSPMSVAVGIESVLICRWKDKNSASGCEDKQMPAPAAAPLHLGTEIGLCYPAWWQQHAADRCARQGGHCLGSSKGAQ